MKKKKKLTIQTSNNHHIEIIQKEILQFIAAAFGVHCFLIDHGIYSISS
jgi:hypothetical protein